MRLPIIFLLATCTLFLGFLYQFLWRKFLRNSVPTGFGLFLPIFLLLFLTKTDHTNPELFSLYLISFFSVIYWLDDLFDLKPIIRIFISFISGCCLFLIANIHDELLIYYIASLSIFYGFFNLVITNVVNFYDGADLNIAVLILLSCISFLVVLDPIEWMPFLIYMAIFTISFSIMNQKSKFLYFGDSGTFAYSCIVTAILISINRQNPLIIPLEFSIPFLLPILDVFTVLILRVKKRDNLLTRNYLHLYQRLNVKFKNKIYLVPQILNFTICYLLLSLLRFYQIDDTVIEIFLIGTTVLTYAFFSKIIYFWPKK